MRIPINVEEVRIFGSFAVFKNVKPPCVVGPHHAHVVGHDVENLSHAMFVKFATKCS